jgi:exodeoxyribonuclease VII large subunit
MKVLSVTELTFAVKSILEPNFRDVSVKGEISNLKLQSSGHLYFSLKDTGAQISAVLFKGSANQLAKIPKEGDHVVATGEISLYAPRGSYQIVVRQIQFLGVGELLLKLHQLKELLQKRGWFDASNKKPLPKFPKVVGIVTSPTGAVIQDILNVISRRFQGIKVILNPVKVQGDGAADEIAQAIKDFNQHNLADVLIVGRGGGSIEDLFAFNEEKVVQAIYESKIPIVSAIGHETDFTLSDFASDVRAPTPSAAAELVVAEKASLLKFLDSTKAQIRQILLQKQLNFQNKLSSLKKHPFLFNPYKILELNYQKVDQIEEDLEKSIRLQLEQKKLALDSLSHKIYLVSPLQKLHLFKTKILSFRNVLDRALIQKIELKKTKLTHCIDHLRSIHPNNLLKKGFSIVFAGNTMVRSSQNLTPKQSLKVLMHDGDLNVTIKEIHERTTTIF